MNNSRMTRKFERLLFEGVPEQPEPIWERNVNAHVYMRQTGKAQTSSGDTSSSKAEVVGTFTFNHETLEEHYESNIGEKNGDHVNDDVESD